MSVLLRTENPFSISCNTAKDCRPMGGFLLVETRAMDKIANWDGGDVWRLDKVTINGMLYVDYIL